MSAWVGKGKCSLAWSKTECQATLACGAEVCECNEWTRKNFGANEWNEPTAGTWMWGEKPFSMERDSVEAFVMEKVKRQKLIVKKGLLMNQS